MADSKKPADVADLIAARRVARREAPAPVNVTVNVAGSVTSEQDLYRALRDGLLKQAGLNPRRPA